MKRLWIYLLLLSLASCSTTYKKVVTTDTGEIEVTETETPKVETEVVIEEVKNDDELLKVKKFTGFTTAERNRFWQYNAKLNETVNSKCYADYITNFEKYNNGLPILRTNGLSRAELITKMRGEKPVLSFEMYTGYTSTVGYTYPEVDKIWFNRKFHKNFSICKSTINLGHELSHKLKFGHDFKRTATRWRQFPYAHGKAIEACCNNSAPIKYNPPKVIAPKKKTCYRSWRTAWRLRCK